jgi:hypothetical protein
MIGIFETAADAPDAAAGLETAMIADVCRVCLIVVASCKRVFCLLRPQVEERQMMAQQKMQMEIEAAGS